MRVGILGGGLQGCCVALSLAERGVDVTLFDRNEHLLSRTAVANEGKVHLGYMYASDPSYSTARMMMRGGACLCSVFYAASRASKGFHGGFPPGGLCGASGQSAHAGTS